MAAASKSDKMIEPTKAIHQPFRQRRRLKISDNLILRDEKPHSIYPRLRINSLTGQLFAVVFLL
jgi:hypothetical protein